MYLLLFSDKRIMRKKKIYLVLTPFFPSETSFRGPYIYDQVKALMKDGRYQVVVMMPYQFYKKESDYDYDGVHVYRFASYDLPTNAWPGAGDYFSLHAFNKALRRIGIHYSDIAVVHAHVADNAIFANYVKRMNPYVKTVLQHHGYDVFGVENGMFAKMRWHKRRCILHGIRLCNNIDLHVGVSNKILQYLEAYKGILIRDKYVLYNGVDFTKFFKISVENEEVDHNNLFRIGCVANFWKLKDQITLIKAVELLLNEGLDYIHVVFVGSGETKEECEQYVRSHKLEKYFEFKGEVDHKQLNKFYNSLDLFVLPSYWDSFGCVYVEAYACGVPFMTAKGTGVTELIPKEDYDKWVIEPHDYRQLSKNIKYFINRREPMDLNSDININTIVHEYLNYLDK